MSLKFDLSFVMVALKMIFSGKKYYKPYSDSPSHISNVCQTVRLL